MIRRLFARMVTALVADDPCPEPSQLDEWDGMVVPALEPDEPVRMPPAVAELLAEQNRGRYALPLDAAKDARIFAYETSGRVVRPVGRHRAVQP